MDATSASLAVMGTITVVPGNTAPLAGGAVVAVAGGGNVVVVVPSEAMLVVVASAGAMEGGAPFDGSEPHDHASTITANPATAVGTWWSKRRRHRLDRNGTSSTVTQPPPSGNGASPPSGRALPRGQRRSCAFGHQAHLRA